MSIVVSSVRRLHRRFVKPKQSDRIVDILVELLPSKAGYLTSVVAPGRDRDLFKNEIRSLQLKESIPISI